MPAEEDPHERNDPPLARHRRAALPPAGFEAAPSRRVPFLQRAAASGRSRGAAAAASTRAQDVVQRGAAQVSPLLATPSSLWIEEKPCRGPRGGSRDNRGEGRRAPGVRYAGALWPGLRRFLDRGSLLRAPAGGVGMSLRRRHGEAVLRPVQRRWLSCPSKSVHPTRSS